MEFRLVGQIKYEKGGAGNEGRYEISDVVFAGSFEEAIKLSRIFIKSHRQMLLNTEARHIDAITATILDENGIPCYKFELVKERVVTGAEMRKKDDKGRIIKTTIETIEPEHLAEKTL